MEKEKWEEYAETVEERIQRRREKKRKRMPLSGKSVFKILEQKRRRKYV